jgi:hypothetical protein
VPSARLVSRAIQDHGPMSSQRPEQRERIRLPDSFMPPDQPSRGLDRRCRLGGDPIMSSLCYLALPLVGNAGRGASRGVGNCRHGILRLAQESPGPGAVTHLLADAFRR